MKNNTFYHFFAIVLILFLPSCFGPTQSYPAIQQIIFISSRFGANMEIYTMDGNGNNQINLTRHQSWNIDPQFSRMDKIFYMFQIGMVMMRYLLWL